MDTDLSLAILQSSFEYLEPSVLLEALIEADGNLERATATLTRRTRLEPPKKRRKVDGGLSSWIKRPSPPPVGSPVSNKRVSGASRITNTRPAGPSINDVLKPTKDAPASPASLPPISLSTPALVAQHLPCTLIPNILDSILASDLFLDMMTEATEWERNRWYMVDRMVESPHTTSFYADEMDEATQEAARFWYNGRKTKAARSFTPLMREARTVVEEAVAKALNTRQRDPMEYAGPWRANVAAANRYEGRDSSVGAHADQLTYLGPQPTIASLTLGVTRTFRLRGGHPSRTYNVTLPHNSLLLMHAGCQERYKHSVPPATALDLFRPCNDVDKRTFTDRINMTFRFYRPDFRKIPSCRCGIPCLLRSDVKANAKAGAEAPARYFWQCQAGAQNDGKSCTHYVPLDMRAEGRGPCIGDA